MRTLAWIISFLAITSLVSGCATWNGVKKDSKDAWHGTKRAIHHATE